MCYELQSTFEEFGKTDADKWHKLADNFFRFMMDSSNRNDSYGL